jgi:hypothetical protein
MQFVEKSNNMDLALVGSWLIDSHQQKDSKKGGDRNKPVKR